MGLGLGPGIGVGEGGEGVGAGPVGVELLHRRQARQITSAPIDLIERATHAL
jgi:hypothetical protein